MLLILVVAGSLIVIAAGMAAGRAGGPAARRWADWLQWAGLAAAAVAALTLAPAAVGDSGWFAAVLLGVPVLLAALPVGFDRITGRAWSGLAWLAAILTMTWAVVARAGHRCGLPAGGTLAARGCRHRHGVQRVSQNC